MIIVSNEECSHGVDMQDHLKSPVGGCAQGNMGSRDGGAGKEEGG